MNIKKREQLFIQLSNEVREHSKFKSLDFSEKLQVIRSIKLITMNLDDKKLEVLDAGLLMSGINERGFNRIKKLVEFSKTLDSVEKFKNDEERLELKKKYRDMIFKTASGRDL